MANIPLDKLRALKRAAEEAGTLPEREHSGIDDEARQRFREQKKAARTTRRAARRQIRDTAPRRKVTFSFSLGDLVRIRTVPWQLQGAIQKDSIAMVMEVADRQILLSVPTGLEWFDGSNLRPMGMYDDDDDDE